MAQRVREPRRTIRIQLLVRPEDEDEAFAYAEERVRASASRLPPTNRASELMQGLARTFEAQDADAVGEIYAEQFVFDDHRRLSGDPIKDRAGMAASERILEQYSVFEGRTLAVRGQCVGLFWSRWADESRNETTYLHVIELGDDGRIVYNGRFDEDDFENAYRELERRHLASEGAAFAESATGVAEAVIAKNRGDLDTLFNELSHPDMQIKSQSRSLFVERSAAEYRASIEELMELVSSFREWLSAVCWLSPSWSVSHLEREAVGRDGEQYEWSRIIVCEVRDGRIASLCDFEVDDEEAAFAYAEERMLAAVSGRFAVTNRAAEVADNLTRAMQSRDTAASISAFSEQVLYDELERRYYAGEGAAFAECGLAASEASIAMNQGDFDRLLGELCTPDMRVENRSRTAFPDRSITDLRASFAELDTMVASVRTWMSVVCWLSPTCSITRLERKAIGPDGELYAWTRLIAAEHREGRCASMCEFDLEDEESAIAYADECVRHASSGLDTTDRAKDEPHDL